MGVRGPWSLLVRKCTEAVSWLCGGDWGGGRNAIRRPPGRKRKLAVKRFMPGLGKLLSFSDGHQQSWDRVIIEGEGDEVEVELGNVLRQQCETDGGKPPPRQFRL